MPTETPLPGQQWLSGTEPRVAASMSEPVERLRTQCEGECQVRGDRRSSGHLVGEGDMQQTALGRRIGTSAAVSSAQGTVISAGRPKGDLGAGGDGRSSVGGQPKDQFPDRQ